MNSTYLFWLSRALTTPMEAPALSWHDPEKAPSGTFQAPAKEGGGFHWRSQSLTAPKKYAC